MMGQAMLHFVLVASVQVSVEQAGIGVSGFWFKSITWTGLFESEQLVRNEVIK